MNGSFVLLRLLQMLPSRRDVTVIGYDERSLHLVIGLLHDIHNLVALHIVRIKMDSADEVLVIKYVTTNFWSAHRH